MSFSLWTKPWIQVVDRDGCVHRRSIVECLTQAHTLHSLAFASPLSSCGVHRLLVSVLHGIYQPQTIEDSATIIAAGRFDPGRIAAFGAEYGERFDLFHPTTPFFQSPEDAGDAKRIQPAARLFIEVPSNTRRAWFTRHYEDAYVVCPACAAAGMCTFPAFATGFGGGYFPTINAPGTLYVLPAGSSLFASLAWSLLPAETLPAGQRAMDAAPWTWEPAAIRKRAQERVGYLEGLNYPIRRFRLLPEDRPAACARCGADSPTSIRELVFDQGWLPAATNTLNFWHEPFASYRQSKEGEERTGTTREQYLAATWLAIPSLLGTAKLSRRALILDHLARLVADGHLPREQAVRVRCIGLITGRLAADYVQWLDRPLALPTTLLSDQDAAACVGEGVRAVGELIGVLHRSLAAPQSPVGEERTKLIERNLYATLTPDFNAFLADVTSLERREVAADAWLRRALQRMAAQMRKEAAHVQGGGASAARGVEVESRARRIIAGYRKRWGIG